MTGTHLLDSDRSLRGVSYPDWTDTQNWVYQYVWIPPMIPFDRRLSQSITPTSNHNPTIPGRVIMAPAKGRELSPEHKAAMAEGRAQSRTVSKYLEALETHKPKRGRRRTPESMKAKLESIDVEIADASAIKQLELIQERIDIEKALANTDTAFDMTELEDEFVSIAAAYGASKGITYAAWRKIGVAPSVLRKAGISRSS